MPWQASIGLLRAFTLQGVKERVRRGPPPSREGAHRGECAMRCRIFPAGCRANHPAPSGQRV